MSWPWRQTTSPDQPRFWKKRRAACSLAASSRLDLLAAGLIGAFEVDIGDRAFQALVLGVPREDRGLALRAGGDREIGRDVARHPDDRAGLHLQEGKVLEHPGEHPDLLGRRFQEQRP